MSKLERRLDIFFGFLAILYGAYLINVILDVVGAK
jgi:hypothetical protein